MLSEAVGSMRRFGGALIGVVLASVAGCAGTGAPASAGRGHFATCAADVLVLRPGMGVVPVTGEHAMLYALVNRGPETCTVRGYPQVTLYDADGRALRFRYADGGGSYVTSGMPGPSCSHPRPRPMYWSLSTGAIWGSRRTRPRSS